MLTRSGAGVLAAAAVALAAWLVVGHPVFLAAASGLAAILAASVLFVLRRPDLTAFQTVSPALVGDGEAAHTLVTATNRGRTRSPHLHARNSIGGHVFATEISTLGAGETGRFEQLLPSVGRGVHQVGPLEVQHGDPLGLWRSMAVGGGAVRLTVHPRIHAMSALPTGLRRELEGSANEQPQEGGISFHSLRAYVPGDDLRLVHWRSVAKNPEGELLVRKNVVTSEPRLMVLLDTSASSYTSTSFEDAASIAASLVVAGTESHYPVMFRTTGGLSADASASGRGRSDILSLLAAVQPSDDDRGLNAVLRVSDRVEGVSLGAVTGHPAPGETAGISRARARFDMVTVVQVGEAFDRPPMRIPGAVVLNGSTADDVAERWRGTFG